MEFFLSLICSCHGWIFKLSGNEVLTNIFKLYFVWLKITFRNQIVQQIICNNIGEHLSKIRNGEEDINIFQFDPVFNTIDNNLRRLLLRQISWNLECGNYHIQLHMEE